MNIDSWDIVPYTRVGVLEFGINQGKATNILGKESLIDFDENETILYWQENALQLVFDNEGLSTVSFYPYIENIIIEEKLLNWNKTKPLFKWLLKNDPSVKKELSIYVFFRYGISVAYFDQHENNNKSMSVFRKGVWTIDDPLLQVI